MKVSILNSAGGSFCWNYATDTFYTNDTGANVCCNYIGFEVLLQLLVDLFVAVIQVTVSVAKMQLEVSAAKMWVTIFIKIMHLGVCCNHAVHYAHDYFYCNYAGDCFCCSYVCDSFK